MASQSNGLEIGLRLAQNRRVMGLCNTKPSLARARVLHEDNLYVGDITVGAGAFAFVERENG